MALELIKGNIAIAEAALRAGLVSYFGYPITPQTELLEHLSARMPELGRAFVQAESELGAINMVYGAACTGLRTMTSSSSPGVSLMQEALSYISGTELPAVIVDVVRGGPGLGNIAPSQADYTQLVHGGGHGEYHLIVLAPASVQEAVDLTGLAFDLAEKYRMVVCLLLDGSLGQMMEPVELPDFKPLRTTPPAYAVGSPDSKERVVLTSINIDPPTQERFNVKMMTRWQEVEKAEVRYKGYYLEDAEYVVIGYGTAGQPWPYVSGQDAEIPSVKSILRGEQYSTVFKDTRELAKVTVDMVDAVLSGKQPVINDTKTYNNGVKVVPSYLLKPVAVDKTNYKQVLVDSGYYTADQLK